MPNEQIIGTLIETGEIKGTISAEQGLFGIIDAFDAVVEGYIASVNTELAGELTGEHSLYGELDSGNNTAGYDGEYVFVPCLEEQIVNTEKKLLAHNIRIEPIPSNYGLITWTGHSIIVS